MTIKKSRGRGKRRTARRPSAAQRPLDLEQAPAGGVRFRAPDVRDADFVEMPLRDAPPDVRERDRAFSDRVDARFRERRFEPPRQRTEFQHGPATPAAVARFEHAALSSLIAAKHAHQALIDAERQLIRDYLSISPSVPPDHVRALQKAELILDLLRTLGA